MNISVYVIQSLFWFFSHRSKVLSMSPARKECNSQNKVITLLNFSFSQCYCLSKEFFKYRKLPNIYQSYHVHYPRAVLDIIASIPNLNKQRGY